MQIEGKLQAMGIVLPDLRKTARDGQATLAYYGELYGKMKPFHRSATCSSCQATCRTCRMAAPSIRAASAPR